MGFSGRTTLRFLFAFLLTTPVFGQALADPWLIQPHGTAGAINGPTTRKDLDRTYGAQNVVDQDVDVGEGETRPGTVIFPKDPLRSIEILWRGDDRNSSVALATIRGDKSQWHAPHHVSLGMSLKELEDLNGRPFSLSGFEWDYGGTVNSWQKGLLEEEFQGHGRVIVRLMYSSHPGVTDAELATVAPDGDFSSQLPVMQKLNPHVYELMWEFQ